MAHFLHSAFCLRTWGQSYSIDWSTIDGGGGTSTGDVYSVTGTIGQPDTGAMSGGNYSVTGGFWALYAVQTPGAPRLTITLSPQPSTITISWPVSETTWQLQATANLATTGSWGRRLVLLPCAPPFLETQRYLPRWTIVDKAANLQNISPDHSCPVKVLMTTVSAL